MQSTVYQDCLHTGFFTAVYIGFQTVPYHYVPVRIRIKLPRQIKNFPARLIISHNTRHNKAVKMRRKTKEAH